MLKVMVVDDSAVVRHVLGAILEQSGEIQVTTASDPLIAQAKMARERPDVILLDLEMPRMDGLTFLRRLMAESPLPVVVCSSHAELGSQAALDALEAGAVEVIAKPRVGVQEFLHESAVLLVDSVRAAAQASLRRLGARARQPGPVQSALEAVPPKLNADVVLPRAPAAAPAPAAERVVVIGASTGGTEALREVLGALPADAPGIVIVQHMPAGFTRAFAQRLDGLCRLRVAEAQDGQPVVRGQALIAPGDRHLLLRRHGAQYHVEVRTGPLVSRHRPSVDVLFRSAAQAAGARALGVIMTGMGDDGASGLLELREAGAVTLAQSEASCVVFGMPKEAIERGAVTEVVPLGHIASALLRLTDQAGEPGR